MPRRDSGKPLLIIPAAGTGSRLKTHLPKFAVPVCGRPMIEWLFDLYAAHASGIVLVVNPDGVKHATRYLDESRLPVVIEVQDRPTGMLDAVLIAGERVGQSDAGHVWITWCDQVAVLPRTVTQLRDLSAQHRQALIVMPTVRRGYPYIHLERDADGQIVRVLHRREGDAMPDVGEGDAGLFSLSRAAFLQELPEYAATPGIGGTTGERNLLPFIPWASARGEVVTFPCADETEAVGVNSPEDLAFVEAQLLARGLA